VAAGALVSRARGVAVGQQAGHDFDEGSQPVAHLTARYINRHS